MNVLVMYGTETGNAELVSEEIAESIGDVADAVQVTDMADVDPLSLPTFDLVVVVCSTYGEGELPSTAQPFHDSLVERTPDLSGLRIATFGLGDTSYETFNSGSETVTQALIALGAERVGEVGTHDASSAVDMVDAARGWADRLIGDEYRT